MNNVTKTRAYGRVNLIGEHTDYNGGWVLPTTIPQYTEITLTKREDHIVSISSSIDYKLNLARAESYELGEEIIQGTWMDYIQGATRLLQDYVGRNGQSFGGMDVKIESNIPEGSGLSSSAALEISFLKAIREAYELKVSDVELALLGQRIENEFVGARVGIMDQMAVSLAHAGEALFLDTYTLLFERIPLPMDELDLMILNSGISHKLAVGDGGYNKRRGECEESCKILGIKHLRDITLEELVSRNLPPHLLKRARHVVSENARVHLAVSALKNKQWDELGKLFLESHASMRDDYEVSVPEIDLLVELSMKHQAVYGARLTGGGFGGSIVAIVRKNEAVRVAVDVMEKYEQLTGVTGTILAKGEYDQEIYPQEFKGDGSRGTELWGNNNLNQST